MIQKKLIKRGLLITSSTSILALFLVSCGTTKSWESSVQLVTSNDGTTLADKSFSESSYNGIRNFFTKQGIKDVPAANDPRIQDGNGIWKSPGKELSDRIAAYKNVKNDGSDIIVAPGFNHGPSLHAISSDDPKYATDKKDLEKVGFVFVDGSIDNTADSNGHKSNPTNIASVAFRSDDGSFLTGVATSVYLNLNQKYFLEKKNASKTKDSQDLTVSGFVGIPLPSTVSFLNGLRLGIAYFNQVIYPHLNNTETPVQPTSRSFETGALAALKAAQANGNKIKKIKWVTSGDDDKNPKIDDHVSGSFSATEPKVSTLVNKLIDKGVSAIIPIAGPQVGLAVNEVTKRGAHTAIIGVDSAQELSDINRDAPDKEKLEKGNKKVIPFSSVKELAVAVENILTAIKTGKASEGYQGFGYNNIGTVKTGSVGVSEAGYEFLIDPTFWIVHGQKDGEQQAGSTNSSLQLKAENGSDDQSKKNEKKENLESVKTLKTEGTTKEKKIEFLDKYSKLLTVKEKPPVLPTHKAAQETAKTTVTDFSVSEAEGSWVIKGDELLTKKSTELPAFTGNQATYPEFPTEAKNALLSGTQALNTQFKWTFRKI